MVADRIATEVQGIVACVANNGRGLKLDGQPEWLNLSKWSEVESIPPRGSLVVVGLDRSGYVRSIVTDPAEAEPAAAQSETLATVDREVAIRRMNVMTTATALLASHGPVDADAMLKLAGRLEAWIVR